MGRPKKQVILFLVEGKSDRDALERPIQKILETSNTGIEAVFLVADTDVTSDVRNNPDNILQKINRFYFEPFFSANEFFYPKDIVEVVHICDLDGAFIPEDNCRMFTATIFAEKGFIYEPPLIYGKTAESVINRNATKAANIRFLLDQPTMKIKTKTVPYTMCYFSANIDHFLHNKLNLTGRDKVFLAEKFADDKEENEKKLIEFFNSSQYSVKKSTLSESWVNVMEGTNSLARGTNFNLYLERLQAKLESLKSCTI